MCDTRSWSLSSHKCAMNVLSWMEGGAMIKKTVGHDFTPPRETKQQGQKDQEEDDLDDQDEEKGRGKKPLENKQQKCNFNSLLV